MLNKIRVPLNLDVENNIFLSVSSTTHKRLPDTLVSCIWLSEITLRINNISKNFSKNTNLKNVLENALIEMMIVNSYENSPPEDGFNNFGDFDNKTQQFIHIKGGENPVASIRWYLLCKETFNHIFLNVSKAKNIDIDLVLDQKDSEFSNLHNDNYQNYQINHIDLYLYY